jgi:hypothetical protein
MTTEAKDHVEGAPLARGNVVVLRHPDEILATLDETGSLDGLPFMPEMLEYYGRSFAVFAKVERACDTISKTGARRMPAAVMLDDLRCDGAAHGGCQAGCRIYWKEAWLRRLDGDENVPAPPSDNELQRLRQLATSNTRRATAVDARTAYRCQATEFLAATTPLGFWDARSWWREVSSGNVSIWRFLRVVGRILGEEPRRRLGRTQRAFARTGGRGAATAPVGLRPGDGVRIKRAEEIAETLDAESKLRGLWFDREMLPYCGTDATVKAKVERFIDEGSGELIELKTDCYILDGVICKGYLSDGRWFCCRGIYPWWREAWLEPGDDAKV